jgi:hypothetical protein
MVVAARRWLLLLSLLGALSAQAPTAAGAAVAPAVHGRIEHHAGLTAPRANAARRTDRCCTGSSRPSRSPSSRRASRASSRCSRRRAVR